MYCIVGFGYGARFPRNSRNFPALLVDLGQGDGVELWMIFLK
jgi:hypothetical protein